MPLKQYIEEGLEHHLKFARLKLNQILDFRKKTGSFFMQKMYTMADGAIVHIRSNGDPFKVYSNIDQIFITGISYNIHIDSLDVAGYFYTYDLNLNKRFRYSKNKSYADPSWTDGFNWLTNITRFEEGKRIGYTSRSDLSNIGGTVIGSFQDTTETSFFKLQIFNEVKPQLSTNVAVLEKLPIENYSANIPSAIPGKDLIYRYTDITRAGFVGFNSVNSYTYGDLFIFREQIEFTSFRIDSTTNTNYFTIFSNCIDSDVKNLYGINAYNYKIGLNGLELISTQSMPVTFGGVYVNKSITRLDGDVTQLIVYPKRDTVFFDRAFDQTGRCHCIKRIGGNYEYIPAKDLWDTKPYATANNINNEWNIFINAEALAQEYPEPPCLIRKESLDGSFAKIEAPFLEFNKTIYYQEEEDVSNPITYSTKKIARFTTFPTQTHLGNGVVLVSFMGRNIAPNPINLPVVRFEIWKSVDNGLTFEKLETEPVSNHNNDLADYASSFITIHKKNMSNLGGDNSGFNINTESNIYFGEGCAVFLLTPTVAYDSNLLRYTPTLYLNPDKFYKVYYTKDYGVTFQLIDVSYQYILLGMTCIKHRKLKENGDVETEAEFLAIKMISLTQYQVCITKDYFTTFTPISDKVFNNLQTRYNTSQIEYFFTDTAITYTGKY